MKRISLITLALLIAGSQFAPAQELTSHTLSIAGTEKFSAFDWNDQNFDFGKVALNQPVNHIFTFMNTGDAPLIISSVQASCGCTVAEYSKESIPPGGKGFVKATYNAAKPGVFNKTITVKANAREEIVQLTIRGEVVE